MRRAAAPTHALVTCEHASARLPAPLAAAMAVPAAVLAGHRGSDLGALAVARALAARLGVPLLGGRYSRLLIDLNRSLGHPQLLSPFSRRLPPAVHGALVAQLWRPHRRRVAAKLAAAAWRAPAGPWLHWGVHSFTPVWRGRRRPIEVGVLFDPKAAAEAAVARRLRRLLVAAQPGLRVALNRPYRGTSDGLTTSLRGRLGRRYLGIELELNQGWLAAGGGRAVVEAVAALPPPPPATYSAGVDFAPPSAPKRPPGGAAGGAGGEKF